jgi:hypothetical protein
MLIDINGIAEFSRGNCLTICAFLVPANVLATLQTLVFTGMRYLFLKLSNMFFRKYYCTPLYFFVNLN